MRTRKELRDKVVDAAYELSGHRYYKGDVDVVLDALVYTIQNSLA